MTGFYNSECPVCLEEFQSIDENLKKERNSAQTGREDSEDPSVAEEEMRNVNAIDLEMGVSRPDTDTARSSNRSSELPGTHSSVLSSVAKSTMDDNN